MAKRTDSVKRRLVRPAENRLSKVMLSARFWAACCAALATAAWIPDAFAQAPPPKPPKQAISLDAKLYGGLGVRIGDSQYYDVAERAGLVLGGSLLVTPSRWFGFGLAYEHTTLGRDETPGVGSAGAATVSRSLDALWVELHLNLVRNASVGWFVTLGPGFAVQSEGASVVYIPGLGQQPVTYACSAGDSLRFGLRGGTGLEASLGGPMWLVADATIDSVQLSSDPIGDCVPGSGTIGVFGLRMGFAFRADITKLVR
jgi:hypothetical protein